MPSRPPLSEEAEQEDRAERDELRRLEGKIREHRDRRQALVNEVRKLSDEQKTLFDARAPRQAALEATHAEHQALGRQLSDLRRQRDAARRRLDEALAALREVRYAGTPAERSSPDQIRREVATLEMRQQTHALPIAEENALIDRLRELTRELRLAEKEHAALDDRRRLVREREAAVAAARGEVERAGGALARAHADREAKMQSMRQQLTGVGGLVAEIRAKGKQRAEQMARLEAANREVVELERAADRLVARSRERRREARDSIRNYNRSVRDTLAGPDVYARNADAQLEQLLKRGRVTLNP
jgi:uncharacterized coiled-coil DUF342 family protein